MVLSEEGRYEISDQFSYLEDSKLMDFAEIRKLNIKVWQELAEGKVLNKGYTKSSYWVKFNLEIETDREWILHSRYHSLDTIVLYTPTESGDYAKRKLGRYLPFHKENPTEHPSFSFHLKDLPSGENTVYMRVNTTAPLMLPFAISSENQFYLDSQDQHIYYGIFLGCIAVMLFYNLFIFISIRDINYLYYVISIFFTLALFFNAGGYSYKYLHPNLVWLNIYTVKISMGFIVIFTAMFASSFLEFRNYAPKLDKILRALPIIGAVGIVLVLTGIWESATNAIITVHAPFLILVGVLAWKRGNNYAKFYVYAWTFYLIGGLLGVLRNIGLLPFNDLTTHAVEVGTALQVILLSLALSERYRVIKMEKEALALKNLEIQQKHTAELEGKVQQRTLDLTEANSEIIATNEELNTTLDKLQTQNVEIANQKARVEKTSKELEKIHKNLQSSVTYAQRIQEAKLPKIEYIQKSFREAFVFFQPKDVVSGDFYWFGKSGSKKIIAIADCTGHGVPGAFMSMIGSEQLSKIVLQNKITQPGEILSFLHSGIRDTLRQSETSNNDGMDIGICTIDSKAKTLTFSGAKNNLVYFQNGELHKIKGNRFSVGGVQKKLAPNYEQRTVDISTETTFYLFSDGFQDQFGGAEGRKFMAKSLEKLLLQIHQKPSAMQAELLGKSLSEWMNPTDRPKEKQIDDILLAGIRI